MNMKTDNENFKWGLFYFNRKDSRIFVPKGHYLRGWTLNFANPFSYFVLSLLVVVFVLIKYYSKT